MVMRRAFTLIELLAVMAILAVLAGIVLAAAGPVREAVRRSRTESILAILRVSLETSAATRGAAVAPAPHPLAGTAAPRSLFRRNGVDLDTSGEALWLEDPGWVATMTPAMCSAVDRFVGRVVAGDVPMFYGVERCRMAILGIDNCRITEHRRVPAPTGRWDADRDGKTDPPFTSARLPDRDFLVSGGWTAVVSDGGSGFTMPPVVAVSGSGSGAMADTILGDRNGPDAGRVVGMAISSFGRGWTSPPVLSAPGVTLAARIWDDGAQRAALLAAIGEAGLDQLAQLGAIDTTPDDLSHGTLLFDELLWSPPAPPAEPRLAPCQALVGGSWRRYRLRGPALYDSWGGEILVWRTAAGGWGIESAGRDGCFRWHPGADGTYQTDVTADTPSGDDRDASRDNLGARIVQ